MRHARLWVLSVGVTATLLLVFAAVAPLVPESWADVPRWGGQPHVVVAAVGVGLLTADVLLPVPSSLLLIGLGAVLGFPSGSLAGAAGLVGSALAGYGIGRLGRTRVRTWLGADHATLRRAMVRHGFALVVATRPVPLLAETVAVLAGCAGAGLGRFLFASGLGAVVTAGLYAAAGAGSVAGGATAWLALATAATVAAAAWLLGRAWATR